MSTAPEPRSASADASAGLGEPSPTHRAPRPTRLQIVLLLGAILVGLLARAPGIGWSANFPFGWHGHHPDEYTHCVNTESFVFPNHAPRWSPHPYPKGLAAHVAVPLLIERAIDRKHYPELPHPARIIVLGRIVCVLYGAATVLVVFLLARLLFRDPWVPVVAAWFTALGGLHVTQSHFFLADVPALFWMLLGLTMLAREIRGPPRHPAASPFLAAAAFCFGVAFGLKLAVACVPSLALVMLGSRPRLSRFVHTAVFALAGCVIVSIGSYSPYDLARTFQAGVADPSDPYNRLPSLLMYPLELPAVMSLPVFLLAAVGAPLLLRRALSAAERPLRRLRLLVVVLPVALTVALLWQVSHFARHLVPLLPWAFMAAAWSLVRCARWLAARDWSPAWVAVPVFAWLAAFVYDGERVFLQEPRNAAASWLLESVPPGTGVSWRRHNGALHGFRAMPYPDERPQVIVAEMMNANHYLSGVGRRDSYPRDYRRIFDAPSQEWVDAWQSVFRGTAGYEEVARFGEGYFMPEYVVTDALLGNRSRNYVSEVVIFADRAREPDEK